MNYLQPGVSPNAPKDVILFLWHYEYKVVLREVTLKIHNNKQVVVDESNNVMLKCKPQKEHCNFDLSTYVWKLSRNPCDLYHISYTSGQIISMQDQEYFAANKTLIYLKLKKNGSDATERYMKQIWSMYSYGIDLFISNKNTQQSLKSCQGEKNLLR